jgi:excisionase family DNA binding protein
MREADMSSDKRLLSAKEAGTYLGISHRTLWAWAQWGWVPYVQLGRRVLFDRSRLDEVIEKCTKEPGE